MPTLTSLKHDLKQQVITNVGNVLKELGQLLSVKSTNYNTLIALQSRFRRLQQEVIEGRVDREGQNVGYGELTRDTLGFIDSLQGSDISTPRLLAFDIFERILVVTKSPERAGYLRQFFPTDYFHSLVYDGSGQPLSAEGYDIVLYDDKPPAPKGETDQLLRHYLVNTKPVVLYFGRYSPLLPKYPEKAYATNSVFSLHARIREMSEYLRYRRAYERTKKGEA